MTDSKLTYLKPPAPSSCYRGCREGCECEQPERPGTTWRKTNGFYAKATIAAAQQEKASRPGVTELEKPCLGCGVVVTTSVPVWQGTHWWCSVDCYVADDPRKRGKEGPPLPVGGVGKAQEHPSGLESHKAIREWAEVATRRLKGTAK